MSEVKLGELLRSMQRTRRHRRLSRQQAIDELEKWLGQLESKLEEAGPSPARSEALTCLRRSFSGVLSTGVAEVRIENISQKRERTWDLLPSRAQASPEHRAVVDFKEDELFDQLLAAAEALDRLVALVVPPPPRPDPWTENAVLDELQPLFGALVTENGDAAITALGHLEKRLRNSEIEMVRASDATAGSFALHAGNKDNYVTMAPAIFVRGELRRPGEARRPRAEGQPAGMVTGTEDASTPADGPEDNKGTQR